MANKWRYRNSLTVIKWMGRNPTRHLLLRRFDDRRIGAPRGADDPAPTNGKCGAVGGLPVEVGSELRGKAETYLVEQAGLHHAGVLAGLAAHLLEVVAPEVAEAKLAEQLKRDEARDGEYSVRLSTQPNWRGRISLRGDFGPESWAVVAAALGPFTKPAHHAGTDGAGNGGVPTRDPRSYDQRLADGLVELAPSVAGADEPPRQTRIHPTGAPRP